MINRLIKKIINERKYGFTLAEVLITLGIIGVVAALTIPVLMAHNQRQANYESLRKALSVVTQASTAIRSENGNSMAGVATTATDLMNAFKPYFKVIETCLNATDSANCYVNNTDTVYRLQGDRGYGGVTNQYQNGPKITTGDGFVYIFALTDKNCAATKYVKGGSPQYCGTVTVDVNGKKSPNALGRDIFVISINKYNTTPYTDMESPTVDARCVLSNPDVWNGADCAHRAIVEGGINYY